MAKFNPPSEFDFDPSHWTEWSSRWSRFHSLSKLDKEKGEVQVDSLLYAMGSRAESVVKGLSLSADDLKSYATVVNALNAYFSPKKYVIHERAKFYRRDQKENESVEDELFALEVEHFAECNLSRAATPNKLVEIQRCQREDAVLSKVLSFVSSSWPSYLSIEDSLLRPYFENRAEISLVNNTLVKGNAVIVLTTMRMDVLQKIHQGHLGVTKCSERASHFVWWPGMSKQIGDMVRHCVKCRVTSNESDEPILRSEFPSRPWEKLGSDLFHFKGREYMLVVDYYSRYVEVALLTNTESGEVIRHMKSIFARHGIPDLLVSDNGPQYASKEFNLFAQSYGFTHVTSSPKHPRSNGAAERAVQTVKRMLQKESDPYLALLAYCSAPLENGFSPAELLMGRKIQTTLPALPSVLTPNTSSYVQVQTREQVARLKSAAHGRERELPPLRVGTQVHVRDLDKPAVVVGQNAGSPRSYELRNTETKKPIRRNRRSLVSVQDTDADSALKVSSFGRTIKPRRVLDM